MSRYAGYCNNNVRLQRTDKERLETPASNSGPRQSYAGVRRRALRLGMRDEAHIVLSTEAIAPGRENDQDTRSIMRPALAEEVGALANLGWSIKSQGTTTAELETREPFNWWLAYASSLMLLGIGGLIYVASWLISSRVRVFLHEEDDGSVTRWGDTQFAARQQLDLADQDASGSSPATESRRLKADRELLALSAFAGVTLVYAAVWFFLVLGVMAAVG